MKIGVCQIFLCLKIHVILVYELLYYLYELKAHIFKEISLNMCAYFVLKSKF